MEVKTEKKADEKSAQKVAQQITTVSALDFVIKSTISDLKISPSQECSSEITPGLITNEFEKLILAIKDISNYMLATGKYDENTEFDHTKQKVEEDKHSKKYQREGIESKTTYPSTIPMTEVFYDIDKMISQFELISYYLDQENTLPKVETEKYQELRLSRISELFKSINSIDIPRKDKEAHTITKVFEKITSWLGEQDCFGMCHSLLDEKKGYIVNKLLPDTSNA